MHEASRHFQRSVYLLVRSDLEGKHLFLLRSSNKYKSIRSRENTNQKTNIKIPVSDSNIINCKELIQRR